MHRVFSRSGHHLRAGLDAELAHLRSLKPEDFKGAEDRVIPLAFMPSKGMTASDFVIQFALPNFLPIWSIK